MSVVTVEKHGCIDINRYQSMDVRIILLINPIICKSLTIMLTVLIDEGDGSHNDALSPLPKSA